MNGSLCAFLDASVLYPVTLRNLLMRLTLNGQPFLTMAGLRAGHPVPRVCAA